MRLEPGAGYWQRELIVPHWRLADLAVARDSSLDEAAALSGRVQIARTLADSNRLAPTDSWIVEKLKARLEQGECAGCAVATFGDRTIAYHPRVRYRSGNRRPWD